MALQIGTRIGAYEVLALLGAGGMGEVYRARDTKLNREVALKVLPETFARDPERMARFEREAQVLASLNHPNIAAIYGLEESGATRALVMELVEGPTLAEKIAGKTGDHRSPLQLDETLAIAKQIADALEAAHEKNIIHRDLKPANIKVKADGVVKVLDFGLAKALDASAATTSGQRAGETPLQDSPTLSLTAQAGFSPQPTRAGIILGTAAYMSPEQAKGKQVDRRTDIWAFGCVLYEMLAGQRVYFGETLSDVLAAVIMKEPDYSYLPIDTPPAIEKLIRRCLVKDAKQRLQAIGDARITIEETIAGGTGVSPAHERDAQVTTAHGQDAHATVTGRGSALRRALPWAIAIVAVIFSGVMAWRALTQRGGPNLNWTGEALGGPSVAMTPRISPDGHTLAFQAMVDGLTQVAVMDTDSGDWTILTKDRTHGFVMEENWSPDGSEIYYDRVFSVPKGIYSVSRFGGDERLVLKNAMQPEVLPDGSMLVTRVNGQREDQLYHFWPDSGRIEPLDATFSIRDVGNMVRVFRDGKDAVFFGRTLEQNKSDSAEHLYVLNLGSDKARRLAPDLDLKATTPYDSLPLAIGSRDRSIITDEKAGDFHRVISIPRHGDALARTLLTLTLPPVSMDMDNAGHLYLDELDRPMEAIRFPASGGIPELVAGPTGPFLSGGVVFQLADGRILLDSTMGGKSRLLVKTPGGEATPFVETKQETSGPACPVGTRDVAFILGSGANKVIAEASAADGHIVQRFSGIPGDKVTGLAASPDGKTIYYVEERMVWAVPASGGQPTRIGPGNSVAADPNGKNLIVQLDEKTGVQLMEIPVGGGPAKPISIPGPNSLTQLILNPLAVAKDGRILATFASADSWFYSAGIFDPHNGRVEIVPTNFTGDVLVPGWEADGQILSSGWQTNSTLWRFQPSARKAK